MVYRTGGKSFDDVTGDVGEWDEEDEDCLDDEYYFADLYEDHDYEQYEDYEDNPGDLLKKESRADS